MKKIAILGCENSHAKTFLGYIGSDPKYSDVSVVGVYSDDPAASAALSAAYGVPVLGSYDGAVGKVDGIIVTARHGANHYKFAKPYIAAGIPMFIDKPVTIDGDEAVAFMKEASAAGVRLSGGSCLKYEKSVQKLKATAANGVCGGIVRAPISLANAYGDFYFYAQHLVETVLTIFGRYPKTVFAKKTGDRVTANIAYEGFSVTALFIEENYYYYAEVQTENGREAFALDVGDDCFKAEFAEFYSLLSGGKQEGSYKDFIAPVFVMNAIVKSLGSGREEPVTEYEV